MLGVTFIAALPAVFVKILDVYKKPLIQSAGHYVDGLVPELCTSWDQSIFLREASPEFKTRLENPVRWNKISQLSQSLGRFQEYEGANGQVFFSWFRDFHRAVIGQYHAKVRFQKGGSDFKVVVILRDGKWKLLYFGGWEKTSK